MNYRRALFLAELGKDAAPHLAVLRRVAPRLEHLLVVAELPTPTFAWLFDEPAPYAQDAATASARGLEGERRPEQPRASR